MSKTVRIGEEHDEKIEDLQVEIAKREDRSLSKKGVVEYALDCLVEKLEE